MLLLTGVGEGMLLDDVAFFEFGSKLNFLEFIVTFVEFIHEILGLSFLVFFLYLFDLNSSFKPSFLFFKVINFNLMFE